MIRIKFTDKKTEKQSLIEYHKAKNILKITIEDVSLSKYVFVPKYTKKYLFGLFKKVIDEHYTRDSDVYTLEKILSFSNGGTIHMVIDDVVYNRSIVKITFLNERDGVLIKRFDTLKESQNYVDSLLKQHGLSETLVQF